MSHDITELIRSGQGASYTGTEIYFRYPPTQPFDHVDRGQNADPCFKDLLPDGIAKVEDLAHNIGAEVHGIQLSKLSEAGKDQLALFVAQKKVVGKLSCSPLAMCRDLVEIDVTADEP